MKPLGLYIHIPFCKSFCPYCDFYKVKADSDLMQKYLEAVVKTTASFSHYGEGRIVDTIYFGGGTPSVMDGDAIAAMIAAVRDAFVVAEDAEITVECNPSSDLLDFLPKIAKAGVNRLSFGMQSSVTDERRSLGRAADAARVRACVELAKAQGIDNISVDLMLGVPSQSLSSLSESLDFISSLDVKHVSAYMLKIEEGTVFDKRYSEGKLVLPTEDEVVAFYNLTIASLEGYGFSQYEVSNFAKAGFESRHNLKYWNDEEYLGIGPAAHSFVDGKRFFFESDIEGFISGDSSLVPDGEGGSFEERVMLALRLNKGLCGEMPDKFFSDILNESQASLKGFVDVGEDECGRFVRLTKEGFLVSNTVIGKILEMI